MARVLLTREFEVDRPVREVWAHLARVEAWPSWARHIRTARLDPPGPLQARCRGTFVLANGIRTTFDTVLFVGYRRWKWRGKVLWLTVDYDHRFESIPGGGTRLTFVVEGEGFLVGSLGRLFARVYARDLDRAIPRLVEELRGPSPSSAASVP